MSVDLSKDTKLAASYQAAGQIKVTKGLDGWRFPVYLVIDHSLSMSTYFRNGSVQTFAERVLALAAHFDDDGTVPTIFFDSTARPAFDVSVHNYYGAIDQIRATSGRMGGTDYVCAMKAVIALHQERAGDVPGLVIFQTDGAPASRSKTTKVLCEAATLPLFWEFVGFGDEHEVPPGEEARFDYLRKLDLIPAPKHRVVDNAGFFPAGKDPNSVSDAVLYDNLLGEFPAWSHAYSAYRQQAAR